MPSLTRVCQANPPRDRGSDGGQTLVRHHPSKSGPEAAQRTLSRGSRNRRTCGRTALLLFDEKEASAQRCWPRVDRVGALPYRDQPASERDSAVGRGDDHSHVAHPVYVGHGTTCNVREDTLLPVIERFFADRLFGPMRLDLLREQLDLQQQTSVTEEQRTAARLQAQIAEADRAIALQVRALEAGVEPELVRPGSRN